LAPLIEHWEYVWEDLVNDRDVPGVLNKYADDGWELQQVVNTDYKSMYSIVFKRRKDVSSDK